MELSIDNCEQLANNGWLILDHFLPEAIIQALYLEVEQLWQSGAFKKSGIGKAQTIRHDIRGDYIIWLEAEHLTTIQAIYIKKLQEIKQQLNQTLFLGLVDYEAHYALYPPEQYYKKHLDQFNDADERMISCCLYFNAHWTLADGGQLKIYYFEDNQEKALEILPLAGRLVLFRSDLIYHEVLPTKQYRYSLTAWLKRRAISKPF